MSATWPGGDAGDSPRVRLPQEDWAFPRAHPRYASVLRRLGVDGRFELLGLVEEGGQALLWAARDHGDGERLVVVKAPDPTSKDTTVGPRLGREARLLELLAGSPHVMPLLTAGPGRQYGGSHGEYESELPWLALPYRPHVLPPAAIAAADGPFTPDQAWTLGHDLAAGLEHLHDRGVVHRDLSPGNVLLTPSGVVIADLGMAWAGSLEDDDVEARFTTGVTTRGGRGVTWGWLAPEAAKWSSAGERPDRQPAADIFCWGLHVFVALVGRHPWAARGLGPDDREQDWMYEGRPADLTGLDGVAVPARFRDLVRAALSADPAGRPDASALLAGLRDEPPSAVLADARVADLEREVRRMRADLSTPATAPGPAAPEGTPRGVRGRLRRPGLLTVPLAALLVAALVAGLLLARGDLRDYRAAGRQVRTADALLAATQLYLSFRDEFMGVAVDDARDLQRARAVADQKVAEYRTRLATPGHDWPSQLRIDLEALDEKLKDLGNARQVVDRLARNGRAVFSSDAGVRQLQTATNPLFDAVTAVTADLAGELRNSDGPLPPAAGMAAPLNTTVVALASYIDRAPVDPGAVSLGVYDGLVDAIARYEVARDDAAAAAPDEEQRRRLLTLSNEDDTFRRWNDEWANILADGQPSPGPTPASVQQHNDLLMFLGSLLSTAAGVQSQVVLDIRSQARELRSDALRRLGITAAVALLVLLAFAAPWLPWRRLTVRRRRRPDEPGPAAAEAAPDRIPAGVP